MRAPRGANSPGRAPPGRVETVTCTGASVGSEAHYTATRPQALAGVLAPSPLRRGEGWGEGLLREFDAEAVVVAAHGDEDAPGEALKVVRVEVHVEVVTIV